VKKLLNKVHHADCLDFMEQIPTGSINLILTDLPYGTTKNEWDIPIPLEPLWEGMERVIKDNGAILLNAQSPFDKILACSNMPLFRYEWIWEKAQATGFLNAKRMPMKAHENILVFYKNLPTYNPKMTKGERKVSKKTSTPQSENYGTHYGTDYDSEDRYPRWGAVFFVYIYRWMR